MPRGKNQRGTSTPRGTGRGNKQHVADEDLRRSSRNGNSISDQDAAQTQLNPQQSYQQLPPSNSNDGEFSQLDVSCLLARVNRLSKDLKFLCDENTQLKGEIILIKSALNSQTKKISELEIELDDLQQYGRRENVCFSNLKIDDKPVIDQVISLCEEINVTVTKNDLVDVHPLPSTRGHAKRIIARFKDRKLGQQVMGARKSAKNIGANKKKQLAADPSRGFGIQPNITSKRAMLLKQAKAAVEKGQLNVLSQPLCICIVFNSLSDIVVKQVLHYATQMDFSVESLHTTEKKMKSEMVRLMKAANVSSVADLKKSALNKLNKGPLVDFLENLVELFDNSLDLCKAAASSVDEMKTKVMDTQNQLLIRQQEDLVSVKDTVQNEMKSWADVVKKSDK
ncbi:hypothetical protein ACHWQZ_G006719 [Mnemiopsis leidyi]